MLLRPTRNSVSLFAECLVGYRPGALDQQNQLTSLARTLLLPSCCRPLASVLLSLLISNRDYLSLYLTYPGTCRGTGTDQ
ncbi:hypothetical protein V2G26_006524 [Clonostachys chloroleuca]